MLSTKKKSIIMLIKDLQKKLLFGNLAAKNPKASSEIL